LTSTDNLLFTAALHCIYHVTHLLNVQKQLTSVTWHQRPFQHHEELMVCTSRQQPEFIYRLC